MKIVKSLIQFILSKVFPFNDCSAVTPGEKRAKMALISIENTIEEMRPKL